MLKEKAHRVALIAKGRLDTDKNFSKLRAKNIKITAIRLNAPWRWAPCLFDLFQPRRMRHDIISRDLGRDIGFLPIDRRIPFQNLLAQSVNSFRWGHIIAICHHGLQSIMQAFKDRHIGRRANRTCIRRKTKKHDSNVFLKVFFAPQNCKFSSFFHESINTLWAGCHGFYGARCFTGMNAPITSIRPVPTCKHSGIRGPINLRQSHKDCRLDRAQSLTAIGPLRQGLKFQWLRGNIGHIERTKGFNRRLAVIIGGPTNQRKTRQRDQSVDLAHMIGLDCWSTVEPSSKGRYDPHPRGFKAPNDMVKMRRITCQNVTA